MEDWQRRVLAERLELDIKLASLKAFIEGTLFKKLPIGEQFRLNRQATYMQQYSMVLGERIEAFMKGKS